MRESLRVRLVLWYALVLTLVVSLYGGAVVYQSWGAMTVAVDAELHAYAREISAALRPVESGRFDLDLPPDAAAYFFRREGGQPYYVIWSPAGELVDQSDPELKVVRPGAPAPGRREVTATMHGATVVVGRDISDILAAHRTLVMNVVLAGLATLALSIFGGWFVAGRALAPIKRISRAAQAMSAGNLDARIPVERTESELEQVASTLNDAFDKLRMAVDQERRFTADASHELRTPISVLRAETEWALDRERTPEQYRDALAVCRRAALRMQDAVERMLALIRAEASDEPLEAMPIAVQPIVSDVVNWLAPLAHERGVRLAADGDTLTVKGDPNQLREALTNVIANAILYNKPGGSVTVSTRAAGTKARIEVVDTGIGIPREAMGKIFDRFFRVDKARSRDASSSPIAGSVGLGGSGLGLSIARAIVEAHGGDIRATSEPGMGSVFVISLPVLTTDQLVCSPTSLL